ncbi:hypothetical protein Cme02nite_71070 [Catellatospora methionotrophica]|uniref:DUF1697 domain-containing protein n=1 Tax=Catellatospora methionotrophica TaxID=121620 RepID=A0A8J3LQ78_9ACTN|nr:DUF1697 domain-containing protein [Catellatospora methionotrophica]GIG18775.1 hypothetical protein Cme02nite_71070 [Catellatospora methionotrophica]
MKRYAGLLRGINVGGHKKISMADLRKLVEGLGHEDVKTLLQSGNVVFGSDSPDQQALATQLEKAIEAELGMSVGCLVRDGADLARIIAANPLGDVADNPSRHFVVFLSGEADPAKLAEVEALAKPGERLAAGEREVHMWLPDGAADTKLTHLLFQKRLGVTVATARNWNTVTKLTTLLT